MEAEEFVDLALALPIDFAAGVGEFSTEVSRLDVKGIADPDEGVPRVRNGLSFFIHADGWVCVEVAGEPCSGAITDGVPVGAESVGTLDELFTVSVENPVTVWMRFLMAVQAFVF